MPGGSTPPSESEEEAPRSIASLRSRFENLAAGNDATVPSHNKAASVSSVRNGHLSAGNEVSTRPKPVPPPKPVSRPITPAPTSPLPTEDVQPQLLPRPPAVPPGRPTTPKPAFSNHQSTPSVSALAESHLRAESPIPSRSSSPTRSLGARRAAPAIPSKPASAASSAVPSNAPSADITPGGSENGEDEEPAMSVKALRERFSGQGQAAAERPPIDVPKAVTVPVVPRAVPAPIIQRTSEDGETTSPVALSPSPEEIDSPMLAQVTSRQPELNSSPSSIGHSSLPSISRAASPAPGPPPVNRAHKPPPRPMSTTPVSTESSPPPIPPNRPALPARSPSISSEAPLPLPPRRPTVSSADSLEPVTTYTAPPRVLASSPPVHVAPGGPPPLPDRARSSTAARTEPEARAAPGPPPPRLPARNNTISVPTNVTPSSPVGPPSHPSSPSRKRTGSGTLPPPPLRSAVLNSTVSNSASPPRRASNISHRVPQPQAATIPQSHSTDNFNDDRQLVEADSEDEDAEPPEDAAISGLSAQARRLLEDHPDTTQANRKLPAFVPDVRIKECHHVSAFAVYGRYVCAGAHHVRIYDTMLSDHAIQVIELKEHVDGPGGGGKVKETKVTAMGFRPGCSEAEEGRWLWCGTKDGHLWEVDITTGEAFAFKAYAHTSAVSHIWRHRQSVLTLDDSGKLLVFEVAQEAGSKPTLTRTLRIGEKFTFAKMLCGKLWTSSGPAARSVTSASSRGPTVRIYDPCCAGNMPPPKSLFTTEWTGAVTSATYMPLDRHTIFMGHEGGYVSRWDGKELVCVGVMKVSNTDVLALEGVGEYLWAGNRKGQVFVYDIQEKPWVATNIWTAHPDNPIQSLVMDPYSIEQAGRYTCWSFARDSLRAWDGLLSVDWIDKQLRIRQPEFCTFRQANILICTWNIDSCRPADLANGPEPNQRWLDECLKSVDSPDIIVFGFQEVIPLTDKKITAKTLLFGSKKDAGATADRVSHAYRQWLEKLASAVRQAMPAGTPYVKIHSESLVGLFTCIFVKSKEKQMLRDLDITTVKRGMGGIYGNKGAIVSRLVMDDTSICFINVHLAAGQSQKASRNADLAGILEDKAIFPPTEELPFIHGGSGTGILDHEMVFLNGDLNYRIDQRRENVISSVHSNELAYLLEHDQLRKEMRTNHAFRLRSFEEPPINFKPTYKYNPGTHDYDTSEKRRIPAWCDRILHNKSPRITAINYQRYEPVVSDHRPVSAGFAIQLKMVDQLRMLEVRRDVTAEWGEREKEILQQMRDIFEGIE
ncbi:hypothetical protein I350_04012 [Cryptococcus amylolentus CBS 6273]|uniref:Inositol polyphosphate-related phosphatase domain-containing protein n=1 Tax=Cryptococcus amylolentus CBS 6273 TaxID=1296118 RepID=A0A1E3K0L0_9TREE|nr:hypothetical protein I350_04012 [Cryptococcus amylolentus CBS 6273]